MCWQPDGISLRPRYGPTEAAKSFVVPFQALSWAGMCKCALLGCLVVGLTCLTHQLRWRARAKRARAPWSDAPNHCMNKHVSQTTFASSIKDQASSKAHLGLCVCGHVVSICEQAKPLVRAHEQPEQLVQSVCTLCTSWSVQSSWLAAYLAVSLLEPKRQAPANELQN